MNLFERAVTPYLETHTILCECSNTTLNYTDGVILQVEAAKRK